MIQAIITLVHIVLILLALRFIGVSTSEMGVVGFFFAMGWIFTAIILFTVAMTFVEYYSTGRWWFLEHRE